MVLDDQSSSGDAAKCIVCALPTRSDPIRGASSAAQRFARTELPKIALGQLQHAVVTARTRSSSAVAGGSARSGGAVRPISARWNARIARRASEIDLDHRSPLQPRIFHLQGRPTCSSPRWWTPPRARSRRPRSPAARRRPRAAPSGGCPRAGAPTAACCCAALPRRRRAARPPPPAARPPPAPCDAFLTGGSAPAPQPLAYRSPFVEPVPEPSSTAVVCTLRVASALLWRGVGRLQHLRCLPHRASPPPPLCDALAPRPWRVFRSARLRVPVPRHAHLRRDRPGAV